MATTTITSGAADAPSQFDQLQREARAIALDSRPPRSWKLTHAVDDKTGAVTTTLEVAAPPPPKEPATDEQP